MVLNIGDQVGELTFLQPNGEPIRLSEFTAPVLVLIFLRHLA